MNAGHTRSKERDEPRMIPEKITVTSARTTARSNIVFTFGLIAAIYIAYLTREVLFLIYVSALFAVVLMPVLNIIQRLHIGKWQPGRAVAILLLFLVVGGLLSLFIMFALPPVVRDMREFLFELPTKGPQLLGRLQRLPIARHIDMSSINAKLQDIASNFATYAFAGVKNGAGTLADILTCVVLTVYFILEGEASYFWAMSFFEQEPRRRLHQALTRAELRMGKWLLGQGSLMLILGVASTIVFAALHIRYAYALGVLMGLFNIVPVAGALVSMSLVILVAALDSWGHVLGVIIFYAIYVQVENAFLTPRIMRSSVDLPGIAVMVALLIGSATAGIVGAMISVPTAVLVAVLLDEYLAKTPKVTLVTDEPVEEVVVHPSGESRPLATPVAHR
jgi:predicted PurR-regulated permease PerM